MRTLIFSMVAGLAALAAAAPAQATVGVACANTDISPTALNCAGFVSGNAIGGSSTSPSAATLLATLGYTGSLNGLETLEGLGGLTHINFNTNLVGQTIIGVHYGNGQGSPGRPIGSTGNGDGDDTAFYLFNAGSGLDTFDLNFSASSNVRLYSTGVPSVPEPSTWAMMLIGFGGMGVSLRRRRKVDQLRQFA